MRFRGAQASLSFELVRAFESLLCGDFVTRLVRVSQLASETSFGNEFQPKATQISNRKSFIVNYKFVMKWLFDSACLLKSPQSKICKKLVGWPGLVIKAHKNFPAVNLGSFIVDALWVWEHVRFQFMKCKTLPYSIRNKNIFIPFTRKLYILGFRMAFTREMLSQ